MMKKKLITVVVFLGISLVLLFTINFFQEPIKSPIKEKYFQEGDIIFVSGTSWRASVLRFYGNPDYTHVGLVVKRHNTLFILQAIPEYDDLNNKSGVVLTPLKHFFSDVASYSILRHPKYIITRHIDEYLGKEFDDKLDRYDNSKIYCTELIDDLLKDNNIKSVPQEIESIWPEVLVRHLYLIGYTKINIFK